MLNFFLDFGVPDLRPFLLLLPGLICDATVWRPQVEGLGDTAEAVVVDLSAHSCLTDMAKAALEMAPDRFCLAGFSMGARVALEIMRLAPERVEKLALLDTGVHPRSEGEAEKRQVSVDIANSEGMMALANVWLPPMVHPDRLGDQTLIGTLREMVLRASPQQYERQITALLNRPDATPQLSSITCPTLIACGRQDVWSPPEQHAAMADAIPGAHLAIIENSGHFSTLEQPEAVTRVLRAWLESP